LRNVAGVSRGISGKKKKVVGWGGKKKKKHEGKRGPSGRNRGAQLDVLPVRGKETGNPGEAVLRGRGVAALTKLEREKFRGKAVIKKQGRGKKNKA